MRSLEYMREALHYVAKDGVFVWRTDRPRSHFKTRRAYSIFLVRDAGNPAGYVMRGYVVINVGGQICRAHRLAWAFHHNLEIADLPSQIDHKDRNTGNNRISNLRPATHSENLSNSGVASNNTSGFKGVSWHKNNERWVANIKINGKKIHLGYFATPELASEARNEAASRLHGEFARAA